MYVWVYLSSGLNLPWLPTSFQMIAKSIAFPLQVPFITFQFTFPLMFPENIRLAPTWGPWPLHFSLWTPFPIYYPFSSSLHYNSSQSHFTQVAFMIILKKKNVRTHIHTHIAFTLLDLYLYISVPDILFVFCSLSKSPSTPNISHESRYFAFIYCYISSKEFIHHSTGI